MKHTIHIPTMVRTAWDIVRYQIFCLLGRMPYPRRVLIALTYRCNSRCSMCNIWKMKTNNELSHTDWQKVLCDPLFRYIEQVDITGGEAILHPEFIKLIELCAISFPKLREISVVTNGLAPRVIHDKIAHIAALCHKNRIHLVVSVSLDGVGKYHDTIRGIPGAFLSVQRTFLYLKKIQKIYPIAVCSGSLLLHQNLRHADDMAKWFLKHNISFAFQLVGFHDTYVRNKDRISSVGYTKEDMPMLLSLLKKQSKSHSWRDFRSYYWKDMMSFYAHHGKRTTPCPFLFDQCAIDAFGDIYYCFSDSKIGNWRGRKTIHDIYFDKKNMIRRRLMWNTVCETCNSGCSVSRGIVLDAKKYLWFLLTGRLWGRI